MKFNLFKKRVIRLENAKCDVCKTMKSFEKGTLDEQKCSICRESFWVK